jgi:hypothetical protein
LMNNTRKKPLGKISMNVQFLFKSQLEFGMTLQNAVVFI